MPYITFRKFPNLKESTVLIKYDKIKRIKLTATNIANGFEEDSTRECFLANGLNIEDSRMFSVAPISRYTVLPTRVFSQVNG